MNHSAAPWDPRSLPFKELFSTLYEVQQRGIEEANRQPGFAYFMEQGLGKTRTVLVEFHGLVLDGEAEILVVVCPRSLRGAWRDEALELGMGYPIILMDNEKKTRKLLNEIGKQPLIIVMHYEQVLTHGTAIITAMLERGKKLYCALDESVRIKKWSSVIGDKLYFLSLAKDRFQVGKKKVIVASKTRDPIKYARVLSGTPAPQGPHDLWNQFRFVKAMEATPYFAWRSLYCRMGGFQGKQILGHQNLDLMRERTSQFAFRAKKKDWTDLPEKIWMPPRQVELTPEQRHAYLSLMHDMVLEFSPEDFMSVEMVITVKNKLQQICSGWVYDDDKQVRELVPIDKNPKLQEAFSIITDIETKSLAFYFFKPTKEYLDQLAAQTGYGYVFLESGLKDAEFDKRKRAFNEDSDIKWAFCQTDAVKEGHTLLGTKDMPCHNTLFIENTYSQYARAQGEDRNHRHGQEYPVSYWDIVTSREDKAIIKALQKKTDMQEALLSEFTAYRDGGDKALHFGE